MSSNQHELPPIVDAVRDGTGAATVLVGGPAIGKTTALQHLASSGIPALRITADPHERTTQSAALDQLPNPPRTGDPLWQRLRRAAPVLLLVDDAHWLDPVSARAVAHAARRVAGHRIGVVLTTATDHPLPDDLARLPTRELPGMDAAAARRAGIDAAAPVLDELLTLCAANPLALTEFAATLTPDQLAGRVPLPRRIRLGRRGRDRFAHPLRDLPPRTRDWLVLLAHGPPEMTTCLRAARALGLDLDDLASAERAGVVHGARWTSPLVREAARHTATLADTARICAALSAVMPATEHPVEHARCLAGALTDPDGTAAALAAATVPLARGGKLLDAYETARDAAARTTDTGDRERYRIISAELAWLAGYGEHALNLLDRAEPRHSCDARASAVIMRAVIHGFKDSWTSGWWLLPTTGDHEPGSSAHALRLLVTATTAGWGHVPVAALQDTVTRLRDLVDPDYRTTVAALERVVTGDSGLPASQRDALRSLAWWAAPSDALHPKAWPPPLLPAFLGDEERYAQLFGTLLGTDPVRGAPSTRAVLLLKLAHARSALGHWEHALTSATEGGRLAGELGHHALHSELLLCAAWIRAARGEEPHTRQLLDSALQHADRGRSGSQPVLMQWIRGLVALSAGRPAEALERLRGARSDRRSPHGVLLRRMSAVDAVEAAVQVQDHRQAVRITGDFERWVHAGAADWAHLDLARCRALLDGDDAEHWHRRALELSDTTGRLFSSARTEFHFGAWLRRRRRDQQAREHLRAAEEHFDRLGAHAWSRRAHAELRAAGETRSSGNAATRAVLTPQEHEIALLAAEGLTNRQIGERLSLSPRTVGYHLYKVFPKLDITSRAQLAAALGAD
ncbi:hypothetical protein IQ251_15300 [Saccharopolyspora sp. HNM0983]|uniref:HTH luxR-type domain-containing protein n=1 Tax=Saccharopolyspora montiporae TaxID=2781240 RepID=A0A929FYI0_9PSEU|nr:LuxR C-terminal-related transcriptional regulator [Saccharopolyspora sp. HNM0983]MBE9375816.1 hypothetical protein [Saccharopolyspora sp. HNM0983]